MEPQRRIGILSFCSSIQFGSLRIAPTGERFELGAVSI